MEPLGLSQPRDQSRISAGSQAHVGRAANRRLARAPRVRRVADEELSFHAAVGWQRAASWRAVVAAAPRLDQAVASRRVSDQGAQARLHTDADPTESARTRAGNWWA